MRYPAILAAAISLAALSGTSVPAAAADVKKGSASVTYSDLDLGTEAGRAELGKRYTQAAREMCGVEATETKLSGSKRYCFERTSKQLEQRVASIISEHDARGD